MQTETFDTAADFLAALKGKPRGKRGRATRPDIPRAGRAERTGLTVLLTAGWSIEFRIGRGYRLSRGVVATPWAASEAAACAAAKGLGQ